MDYGFESDCQPVDKGGRACAQDGIISITETYSNTPGVESDFNAAVEMLEREEYAKAIDLLKAVTGRNASFSAPYINMGIAYSRIGDMEKAEESLEKALEINDRHPVTRNELGLVYRKTGRYREARELYQSTLSMYPGFLPTRKNLGVLCDIYMQDYACALHQYEEYLKRVPGDEKVKIWVADVKSRLK